MPKAPSTLAKQTKTDVLNAYSELLSEFNALQEGAGRLTEPANRTLFEKTKELSSDSILSSFSSLKITVADELTKVADRISTQLKEFGGLGAAIELAEDKLRLTHGIEIVANTLATLIQEYEEKQKNLEQEFSSREFDLSQTLEKKRKEWAREQEEHEYERTRSHRRGEEEYSYEVQKRGIALDERESVIKEREGKMTQLEKEVMGYPQKLQEIEMRAQKELEDTVEEHVNARMKMIEQERISEQKLISMERSHLEMQLQKQQQEISELRTALTQANAQAQMLASKAVEGIASAHSIKQESQITK